MRLMFLMSLIALPTACGAAPEEEEQAVDQSSLVALPIHGVDSIWTLPHAGQHWLVEQRVRIDRSAPHMFWAMQTNHSEGGVAYMGLQSDAHLPDGSVGRMAIFSLWNATSTRNGTCSSFTHEGTGKSCHLAYPWVEGQDYLFRMRFVGNDGKGDWWRAEIKSVTSGVTRFVGEIRAPAKFGLISGPTSFAEIWGGSFSTCNEVPPSKATFFPPIGTTAFAGSHSATGSSIGTDDCAAGQFSGTYGVLAAYMGYGVPFDPPGPAGCNVLHEGRGLIINDVHRSCDGRFVLLLQHDGNLALLQHGSAIWSSNTAGTTGAVAFMQNDGNFVIYDREMVPVFSTGTNGYPGAFLALQDDGNLVIYSALGQPLWWSGTGGR